MKQIDNTAYYTRFYIGVILLALAGVLPLLIGIPYIFVVYLPYFTTAVCITLIAIFRPAYFSIMITPDRLQIQSSISGDETMEIRRQDYAGYKITPHVKGWRNDLVIFRKSERGLLQSRVIRVSLLNKEQIKDLNAILTAFQPVSEN